jgi:hypothetical protein
MFLKQPDGALATICDCNQAKIDAYQAKLADKHVRNFFDGIKSRQKPVADFEIGFHSTLPALLGCQSIKDGRPLVWDETALTAESA